MPVDDHECRNGRYELAVGHDVTAFPSQDSCQNICLRRVDSQLAWSIPWYTNEPPQSPETARHRQPRALAGVDGLARLSAAALLGLPRPVGITTHNFVSFAHAALALCLRATSSRCRVTPKSSRGGIPVCRAGESEFRAAISGIRAGDSAFRGTISGIGGGISGIRGTISGIGGGDSGIRGVISVFRGMKTFIRGTISGIRGTKTFCRVDLSSSSYAKSTFLACIAGQKTTFRRRTPDFLRCTLNHQPSTMPIFRSMTGKSFAWQPSGPHLARHLGFFAAGRAGCCRS